MLRHWCQPVPWTTAHANEKSVADDKSLHFTLKLYHKCYSKICSNLKVLQLKVVLLALTPLRPLLKTRIRLIETWEEM